MANDSISRTGTPQRAITRPTQTETAAADTKAINEGLKRETNNPASVRELQKHLNATMPGEDTKLAVDGKFGPLTEAALKKFQKSNGLPETGTVDTATLGKIQGKEPAKTEPAKVEERQQASAESVDASRTKMKSREELMKARIDGATKAQDAGMDYSILNDQAVQTAHENIDKMTKGFDEHKAQITAARETLGKEIKALEETKRTPAQEYLLHGKKSQDTVLKELSDHVDLKKQGLEAAREAISDGILNQREVEGMQQLSDVVAAKEKVLGAKAEIADRTVAGAERAGATVPAIKADDKKAVEQAKAETAKKTETAATAVPQPKLDEVKAELKAARASVTQQRADLDILKSAPPKDPAARGKFDAEVGLKEQELKLTQKRASDLGIAEEKLAKGPLSADDAKALQTSKEQFETQTTALKDAKKAFDSVAAIKDKMVSADQAARAQRGEPGPGTMDGFVAGKRKAVNDAQDGLDRAKGRGNEDAIRAAFAKLEKAKAEHLEAERSQRLVEETHRSLNDGQLQASEQQVLGAVQTRIDDAKARAAAMDKRLPELNDKKQFLSDFRDRVFSWFNSSAETSKAASDYGREVIQI